MPFDNFDEQMAHLPKGATITITASPQLHFPPTIEEAEMAAAEGFEVVPPVAAQYLEAGNHFAEIVDRLADAGVTDIFVPGRRPGGANRRVRGGRHHRLPREPPVPLGGDAGRGDGEEAAVHDIRRQAALLRPGDHTRVDPGRPRPGRRPAGVGRDPGRDEVPAPDRNLPEGGRGDSVRFLQKTTGIVDFVKQFIGSRGKYEPDDLVEGLAPFHDDPELAIQGLHVYTFNQVPDTESWRRDFLESHR